MPANRDAPNPHILWFLVLAGSICIGLAGLIGCREENPSIGADGPHYVTTIPPFAALLAPVIDERGQVTALLTAGDSPHTYEPRPSDVQRTEGGTALFYGAPHLDGWAADLSAPHHVALLDLVPEGYQHPAVDDGHGATGGDAIDPHFWTDPLAVRALLPALADTLCALDAAGCATYEANADSLAAELIELDAELRSLLSPVRAMPVLLAQPFFQYFMHRYGPRLVGVVEPHPGKEPSPRALQALIARTRREGVRAVFIQRQLPPRAAEAVAEAAGLSVVTLDPIGGAAGRRSYRDLLLHNARTIRDALSTSSATP